MNFELTEAQELLRKSVKEFAEKELLPGVIQRDETSTFPVEAYRELGRRGWLGLPFSKEFGGSEGGYMGYVLAVEEISKVDASLGISFSVATSLCAGGIYNMATEEQKKKYIPQVISGRSFGSFGLTEPGAGSDAGGVVTKAVKKGDHYVINGSKCFITNGPLSDVFLIIALTAPEKGQKGLSAFIVEKNFPGFRVGKLENKMGIRSAQVSELFFEDLIVPEENLVGGVEEQGFKTAMKALDGGRIGVAAQGLGLAEGAFEIARTYLMEREQFGKPLYKNQYLAFKMVELSLEIEQAKYLLYQAALEKDAGRPYTVPAAKAKLVCTNAAMHVTTECVQLLGGNGYMKDYHVERMMRDAKITQIYEGTNEIQRLVISGQLFR